jgi:hypothetical protein
VEKSVMELKRLEPQDFDMVAEVVTLAFIKERENIQKQ